MKSAPQPPPTGGRTERPDIEQLAARNILHRGVQFKMAAPWYIRWLKKEITVTLTSPYLGTLMKVSQYYLSTGLKDHQLEDTSVEQGLALMSVHGKALSKALATALLNGRVKQYLFTKMVARYLRWHCRPQELFALVTALLIYGGTADFLNTTRSVRQMKMTDPRLGHKDQGS